MKGGVFSKWVQVGFFFKVGIFVVCSYCVKGGAFSKWVQVWFFFKVGILVVCSHCMKVVFIYGSKVQFSGVYTFIVIEIACCIGD